ncbi:hypothetical protein AAFF_G00393340 [Aldrovandia affinis]|uniref:Uncharacterized protein n=1 Tax=Aldrovandia affinis TaxID=143900 RepID=A0AAD7SDG5_9TELE|nr:hypothetical protein AAFF_G00393340 [Aldrovandia affinis]
MVQDAESRRTQTRRCERWWGSAPAGSVSSLHCAVSLRPLATAQILSQVAAEGIGDVPINCSPDELRPATGSHLSAVSLALFPSVVRAGLCPRHN